MELENRSQIKQEKVVSALIWCLAILLCATFIACLVVGMGFFRILRVQAAVKATPVAEPSVVEATPSAEPAAVEVTPTPTPEIELPTAIPAETASTPTVAPTPQTDTSQKELNPQAPGEMQLFASIPDVVEAASGSVVAVIQYQPNERTGKLEEYASGSGFIVSENGYILTNAHVVSGAASVGVMFSDGEKKPAQVIGADVSSDIAVLKVEGENYPALPIGDSSSLRVGEYVIAIGNPLSAYTLYGSVTFGIISATARELNIDGFVNTYLQTDAAINFGNSGGPLINMAGQVIGMNSAKSVTAGYDSRGNAISAEGIGFALPINNVMQIVDSVIKTGSIPRPGIGVTIATRSEEDAAATNQPAGVYVYSITEGGPADQAGLQVNDVILALDGEELTRDGFVEKIRSKTIGDQITFTILRNGETMEIVVTVGDLNLLH